PPQKYDEERLAERRKCLPERCCDRANIRRRTPIGGTARSNGAWRPADGCAYDEGVSALASERHEPDRQHAALDSLAVAALLDDHEILAAEPLLADRDHHAAARSELIDQGLRHVVRRGGDDDGIERCRIRPTQIPIADARLDVAVAELLQQCGGTFSKRPHDLD